MHSRFALILLLVVAFLLPSCGDGEGADGVDGSDGTESGVVDSDDPAAEVRSTFLAIVRAVRGGDYDEVFDYYSTEALEFMNQTYAEFPELGSVEEEIERSWSTHAEAFAASFGEDDVRVRNLDVEKGTAEVHWRYPGTDSELENASFFEYVDGEWKLTLGFGADVAQL